jgi:hypothetical protein
VADARFGALELEDHVPQVREADLRRGLGRGLAGGLESVPEELHLLVDLDPQQVVRRADVLPLPVPGVSRDVELDLLEQSAVRFDAFSDIWDVVPSRFLFSELVRCI